MKTYFSRRELEAAGMPFGDSATRVKSGGRGRIYGGGGGGGGGVKYDNLERLYDVQARQAESLMAQANENVYPAYNALLDEARNTGSQANQEKNATKAAADVAAAQGGAKKQLEQQLSSMGINPSDPRYVNTLASMDLDAAAQSASAQTGARDRTRDLGFAKLTDTVNAGMGIGSNAVAALNSAGGMASNIAGLQQNAANMSAQNTANIASLGTRLLMMKNGGLVRKESAQPVRRFAAGGFNGTGRGITGALASITPPPPPPSGARPPSAAGSAAQTAVMGGGAKGLGTGIEKVGNLVGKVAPDTGNAISSFGQGLRLGDAAKPAIEAYQGAADVASVNAANAASTANEIGVAADMAAGTTEAASTAMAAGEAAAGAEAASLAAVGGEAAAGTTAAAMGAGSTIGAALGAAMPWVGAAMLIGSAFDLFADGGEVKGDKGNVMPAIDATKGGLVDGVGGPKDDLNPALLSHGEYVLPVGAVKLIGIKELEKLRARGLRYEKQMGIA